jgi:hypothetical protein
MKPKSFIAPSAHLTAPEEWTDNSHYILLGPPADFRSSVVITFTAATDPSPDACADRQLADLQQLPDYKLYGRSRVKLPGVQTPAARLDYAWKQPTTPRLRQLQHYVLHAGTMYTITATATEAGFAAAQRELEQIVMSFEPRQWKGS